MRVLCCLSLILVLAGIGSAQSILYGPGSTRGFQTGYSSPQTIVRDSKANLYVIYRYQVTTVQWDIAIARSTNTGASWNMTWQTAFTTPLGSDFGNYHPCIAIDSQAILARSFLTGSSCMSPAASAAMNVCVAKPTVIVTSTARRIVKLIVCVLSRSMNSMASSP